MLKMSDSAQSPVKQKTSFKRQKMAMPILFMVKNGNAFADLLTTLFSGKQHVFPEKSLPSITIYYHNGFSILKQPVLNIQSAHQFVKWILPQP